MVWQKSKIRSKSPRRSIISRDTFNIVLLGSGGASFTKSKSAFQYWRGHATTEFRIVEARGCVPGLVRAVGCEPLNFWRSHLVANRSTSSTNNRCKGGMKWTAVESGERRGSLQKKKLMYKVCFRLFGYLVLLKLKLHWQLTRLVMRLTRAPCFWPYCCLRHKQKRQLNLK